MTTFKEAVYMVLDLLKQVSDDAYYTEEHIMFLLSKVRATLLTRKYAASRNQSFQYVDRANYQFITFELESTTSYGTGKWYKNDTVPVPRTLPVGDPKAFVDKNLANEVISVVPPERFAFVGYNKWLKNNIYCSVSNERNLYVKQLDEDGEELSSVKLYAIFENALESTPLSSDAADTGKPDILDMRFPLEEQLLTPCIEMVVQELTGAKFSPEDRYNNGKDDMSDAGYKGKAATPVTNGEN